MILSAPLFLRGRRFRGTRRGRADWCEVSPTGHQNNGAGSVAPIIDGCAARRGAVGLGRGCLCLHSREGRCLLYCCWLLLQPPSSLQPCAPSDKRKKVRSVFSLPIIGETGESFDVMLPICLSFISLVPLLGRRISFGDGAFLFQLVIF